MNFSTGLFSKKPIATLVAIALLGCALLQNRLDAQGAIDPTNIWYRAFLLVQAAEKLEEDNKYLEALNKFNEAQPLYLQLEQNFPDFQPEIIKGRRRLIAEKRDKLKYLMRGGASSKNSVETPVQPMPNPGATKRETEFSEPDGEFALPTWNEGDGSSQALPRIGSDPVRTPSVGEVSVSLYEDLTRKDKLISQLISENDRLRNQVNDSDRKINLLKDELLSQGRKRDELNRRANGADGAERQHLKKLLAESLELLEKSSKLNKALVAENEGMRAKIGKLQSQKADLERERDSLLEVVSGEGSGGRALKELMDRNAELSRQLDRAEKLASSLSALNSQKDSDIALLKSEIKKVKLERENLVADNVRHQKTIDQTLLKLQMLSGGLSPRDRQALARINPIQNQENELLRSLVLKKLRREAQIKQAKELLLQQLEKVGVRSEALLAIVDDIASSPQLTAEEKALFRDPQSAEIVEAAAAPDVGTSKDSFWGGSEEASVSATLIAPGSSPDKNGIIKNQKISVELEQLDKSARLDFKEGRYAQAEAGYLRYLHFKPRSVSTLCNLGVLKIAMKNYSEAENFLEKALAMDNKSGLANYLLGRTYFLQNRLDDALVKLEMGIKYDPQNAKAHNTLGVISSRKGLVSRAERAFTKAVSIDPEFGDAHFNLAVLYATRNPPVPKKTNEHYLKAYNLGVPRSAEIEGFLKEAEAAGVKLGSL